MSSATIPAPVGGWNARDSLANMPLTDASVLENIIPLAEGCRTRPGYAAHSSDLGDAVETLVTYDARGKGGTETLICATDGDIKDITAGGAGTDLGTGFSIDQWQTEDFGTRKIFCNGTDAVQDYDGTTLTATAVYMNSIISNGDFASDTLWTKGTGWTIAAGVASCDGSQVGDSDLTITPNEAIVASQTYVVQFVVSNYSAGNVTAVVGDTEGTDRSADGTFTETITAGAGADLDIRADASFVGDIDDVKIARTNENFITCFAHHGRMFYIEDDAQTFHYADAGAYAGYTSKFDLSTVAGTSSRLMFGASWSRDGGAGMDDLACFFFQNGKVAVYSGTDPASASDWSLVGVFKIGTPLGRRAATQIGGDLIIATSDGYVPISIALVEGQYSEQSAFSFKIDKAVKNAAQTYKDNFGWSSIHFPQGSWYVVNVPISTTESQQHLRNTITGAWCKIKGWNAVQFSVYDDNLYFGSPDGFVYKVSGASDDGAFINFKSVQAYSYLGNPHIKKQATAIQVFANYTYPTYISHAIWTDFNPEDYRTVTDPPEGAVSEWDVGDWDVAEWGGENLQNRIARQPVTGTGFALAHVMQFRSKAQAIDWNGTQIWFKEVGIV